jgi:4-carboxymuconolactone decarboxylase
LRPAQRALYDRIVENMVPWAEQSGFQAQGEEGHLIGPFNAMLLSPELSGASLDSLKVEGARTSLGARVREIVILTVGSIWGASYELYAHSAVGAKAGLHEDTIRALVSGHVPEGLSELETVAHEFTHMLVAEHKIDAGMYRRALAAFGEKALVDLIYLAGNYMTVSALLNTFDVPAPQAPPIADHAGED